MKIHLITMWYNEEFLAPFFLNHYAWVDTIHILLDADSNDRTEQIARRYPNVEIEPFRFPDMMNDVIKSTAISQKYRTLCDADYVIIVDSDEFIFPWDTSRSVREHLNATRYDAYFVNLWQIYKHESDCPLDPQLPVFLQRRHGDPQMESAGNIGYLKPVVVKGGLDIFWGIGNHYIVSNGVQLEWATRQRAGETPLTVATTHDAMLQGAHWRLVDLAETITRRIVNRKQRQSAVNLDKGLTAHYHQITEADIIREYEAHCHDPLLFPTPPAVNPDIGQLEQLKGWFQQAGSAMNGNDVTTAVELYRQCLQIMPQLHDARLNLACSLGSSNDFETARHELTIILCDQPEHIQARSMLGKALLRLDRAEEALEQFMLLQRSSPQSVEFWRYCAESLYALQRYDQARNWIEQVLVRQPDDYPALQTLAAIERTENPGRSVRLYQQLAQRRPDDHRTRLFHATLLLSLGNFAEGWREFEERLPTLAMSDDILSIPRWHGQPLAGKSIVLVAEQGHGDALQFIRYATLVAQAGARVLVLCHNDQIRPVLKTVAGVEVAVIPKEPLPFLPDFHVPLMSLPFEFGTTLDTIPRHSPYLAVDSVRRESWRQRLASCPGLKVGLAWGGNRAQADNSRRSVPFEKLQRLFSTPGVTFISLQVGPDALKHQSAHHASALVDWSDELHDFSDTAALVDCLDLVISICSGVTHLCGGLGVETWVMLQYDADWRWLRDRDDTPWYPSLRLFRQKYPGEWDDLLERLQTELSHKLTAKPGCGQASASYQLAVAAFNAGDLATAENRFRTALQFDPNHHDSLNGLATILDLRGETETAITLYQQALASAPDTPLIQFNLANCLRKTGHLAEAEQLYRQSMAIVPSFAPPYAGLGNLLLQQGRQNEAETVLLACIASDEAQPDAWCDLGVLATQRGDLELAEQRFQRGVRIDPAHPAALNHLGMLLMRQNRLEEAERYLRQAVAAKPDYRLAMNNLGVLLHWEGRHAESEACHRSVIAAQPDNGTAHFNLALVLLSQAKFSEGWREYEYRFVKENPVPLRHGELPRWNGEDCSGKTILVHAEQGYGDTIQFARYLPLLAQRGCAIIFECQDRIIAPLFVGMPSLKQVISRGEQLPAVDFQVPLMSLPLVLGEAAWHEPVAVNYLTAEPQLVVRWQERLADLPGRPVGLVWSGRRGQDNNHNRMIPPETFTRLASLDGVSFVNLLVGVDDPAADALLAPLNMFDARPFLTDFAESAALLASLDLLVSVDTATSHLAGALGLDTRVMIPYNADWRWTFGLPDCPLYPSVTLYRQEQPFEWEPVLDAVRSDLISWCNTVGQSTQELLAHARTAREQFRWEEALAWYLKALDLDQLDRQALSGVGASLQMLNRAPEALAWYDSLLQIFPDDATVHCNRALVLLTIGNYPEGWQELQWRKRMLTVALPPFPMLTPEDMGEIAGKRILLHAEQGFGDTIQMIRYAGLLAERGAVVAATVPRELVRLISWVPGIRQVIPHGEPLPQADYQALMMDLPWLFGTTPATIPVSVPYLRLPHELVAQWGARIAPPQGHKIGLLWGCGGANLLNRRMRSLPFEQIAELIENTPNALFYSLQIGSEAISGDQLKRHPNLYDLTGEIRDFADTAALIQNLDAVITIDSAVAHLAGALGKPVSLLLPSFREWRWIDTEGRALWYPTVQVFDQMVSVDLSTLIPTNHACR